MRARIVSIWPLDTWLDIDWCLLKAQDTGDKPIHKMSLTIVPGMIVLCKRYSDKKWLVRSNRGVLTRKILLYNDKVLRWTMDPGRGILSDSNNSVVLYSFTETHWLFYQIALWCIKHFRITCTDGYTVHTIH